MISSHRSIDMVICAAINVEQSAKVLKSHLNMYFRMCP